MAMDSINGQPRTLRGRKRGEGVLIAYYQTNRPKKSRSKPKQPTTNNTTKPTTNNEINEAHQQQSNKLPA
eukprot:m.61820 g.61820  ORF g.61820 m.61820 type:complete len:70 (+) comp19305_c1_seq1:50-259(+)